MKHSFKEYFNIPTNQQVDFLNIPLDEDLKAFICPFLIANNRQLKVSDEIFSQMKQFLEKLNRQFVMTNDKSNGIAFLSKLNEPNEYHLGYSNTNKGKAIHNVRAETIFGALNNNKFAKQGNTITNEAHNVLLLVKGIGQDIMSDAIANVCRNILAEFTYQQCLKHNIPTSRVQSHYYDILTNSWKNIDFELPYYKGKPIILIPEKIIAGGRSYSNNYNYFVAMNNIASDILNGKIPVANEDRFINKMKDGTRKAIIKEIYKEYSKPKAELIDFVLEYNDSLSAFLDYAKENYPALDLSFVKD
jgi:hypothetical protein